MLKDIQDSQRIDRHIKDEMEKTKKDEQKTGNDEQVKSCIQHFVISGAPVFTELGSFRLWVNILVTKR